MAKAPVAKSTGPKLVPGYSWDDEKKVLSIDPDIVYPAVLDALDVKAEDVDQYWVEVAYQCAKLAGQEMMSGTPHDPRETGNGTMVINILSRKDTWAVSKFKPGRGPEAATKGREARNHYEKIKRKLTTV